MPIEGHEDRRRGAARWFDELVFGELGFVRWLETVDGDDRTTVDWAVDREGAACTSVSRGQEDRAWAQWADARLAVFDEPSVGKGFVSVVRLHLLHASSATGQPGMSLVVQRPDDDIPVDLGWQGPISGRLLLATSSIDFRACNGSRLARNDEGSLLKVVLDSVWTDGDETPGELLAALDGVLVMRET